MAFVEAQREYDETQAGPFAICKWRPVGPHNPLGARALYLYRGARDILFRLHGTNEPWLIGQAVSNGCIRPNE
uniref:L,D-TPase catalytic domain-containing protein n=1 Tax=Sinorhizobium sp. M14 TaxID=430451 RepID=A0A142BPM2_9HYPH|nr:hypothetical protein pSinB_171 [Sinorhizobium sp. M14]